jgi:hypothetical protein
MKRLNSDCGQAQNTNQGVVRTARVSPSLYRLSLGGLGGDFDFLRTLNRREVDQPGSREAAKEYDTARAVGLRKMIRSRSEEQKQASEKVVVGLRGIFPGQRAALLRRTVTSQRAFAVSNRQAKEAYSLPSPTSSVTRTGGLAARPESCRTIASRSQKLRKWKARNACAVIDL